MLVDLPVKDDVQSSAELGKRLENQMGTLTNCEERQQTLWMPGMSDRRES
jgi:hypothetical protein